MGAFDGIKVGLTESGVESCVGITDGSDVGKMVGFPNFSVGATEEIEDGPTVNGLGDGYMLDNVGSLEGTAVGSELGVSVGNKEGCVDGTTGANEVDESNGGTDGLALGNTVGSSVVGVCGSPEGTLLDTLGNCVEGALEG